MKRKKAVCGRLGAFGSLDFLSVFAFFAFGAVELDFFLPNKKKKKTVLYPEKIALTEKGKRRRVPVCSSSSRLLLGGVTGLLHNLLHN